MSDAVRVKLLERNDSWYFGHSKLDVRLGRQSADDVRLHYSDVAKDGVEFRRETVTGIDPVARRVSTHVGSHDADYLVLAMGADYDMAATPGLRRAATSTTRSPEPSACGTRCRTSTAAGSSCPCSGSRSSARPHPFEGAFMLHEHFKQRGMADAGDLVRLPMQRPVPVTGDVAQMFREGLAARGITELPEHLVTGIDPSTRTAQLANGETLPYDLFVGIPKHRAPDPLPASNLTLRSTAACRSGRVASDGTLRPAAFLLRLSLPRCFHDGWPRQWSPIAYRRRCADQALWGR